MLKVTNTKNLAGITISGDYEDLENLLEAIYEISIDEYEEKSWKKYYTISTRLLALAYEVRHAIQGDRDVDFVDNGINRQKMIEKGELTHLKNVQYSCKIYYPELMFDMLVINELIRVRMDIISNPRNDYDKAFNKAVVWDQTISVLRLFQSQVVKAVKEILTDATFKRWLNIMNPSYSSMCYILDPYIDKQNIEYLTLNREKREKQLSVISKRIAEYKTYKEFIELKEVMYDYSAEFNVPICDIKFDGMEYPEKIDW